MKINKIKLSILAIMSLAFVGCGSSGGGHDHSANISQQAKNLLNANRTHSVRNEQDTDISEHSDNLDSLYTTDGSGTIITTNVAQGFVFDGKTTTSGEIKQESNDKKVGAFLTNKAVVSTNENILVHGTDGIGAIVSDGSSLTIGKDAHSDINIDGTKAIGFISGSKGSSVSLEHNSKVNMLSQHGVVLAALDGGRVENRGYIELKGNHNIGLLADGKNSIAVNYGTIKVMEQKNTAMMARNGGTIVNEKGGVIELSSSFTHDGNNAFAKDEDKNSRVINNGKVVVKY